MTSKDAVYTQGFAYLPVLIMVVVGVLMVPVSKYVVSSKGEMPGIFRIDGRLGLDRETLDKIEESDKKDEEKYNPKPVGSLADYLPDEEKKALEEAIEDGDWGEEVGTIEDFEQLMQDKAKERVDSGLEIPMGNGGDGGVSGEGVDNGSSGGSGEGKGCPAKGIVIGDGETAFGPRTSGDRYSIYECNDGVWKICPNCKEVTYGPEYLIDVYYEYEGIEVEEDEEVYEGDEWGVFGEGYGEYWRDLRDYPFEGQLVYESMDGSGGFYFQPYEAGDTGSVYIDSINRLNFQSQHNTDVVMEGWQSFSAIGCGESVMFMLLSSYASNFSSTFPEFVSDNYSADLDGKTNVNQNLSILEENGLTLEREAIGDWTLKQKFLKEGSMPIWMTGVLLDANGLPILVDGDGDGIKDERIDHHVLAVGVDENDHIIYYDPYYGYNFVYEDNGMGLEVQYTGVVKKLDSDYSLNEGSGGGYYD